MKLIRIALSLALAGALAAPVVLHARESRPGAGQVWKMPDAAGNTLVPRKDHKRPSRKPVKGKTTGKKVPTPVPTVVAFP
jgi:hypothetical protein